MAGFTLREGSANVEIWTITSQTISAGDLLMWTAGTATAVVATAAAIAYDRMGVAMEDRTTAHTTVQVYVVSPEQKWEVESASSSSSSDNGDAMILTDKNTVNNTGTNSVAKEAVVVQLAPVGATGDKRILVRFVGAPYGLTFNAT